MSNIGVDYCKSVGVQGLVHRIVTSGHGLRKPNNVGFATVFSLVIFTMIRMAEDQAGKQASDNASESDAHGPRESENFLNCLSN
jgi:hypothetical protein